MVLFHVQRVDRNHCDCEANRTPPNVGDGKVFVLVDIKPTIQCWAWGNRTTLPAVLPMKGWSRHAWNEAATTFIIPFRGKEMRE